MVSAGCQIGPDDAPAPPGPDAAELLVTAEHGSAELLREDVSPGRTVLRTLQNQTPISTGFGGGFVASMFDRSSDAGTLHDWFYFVDGVLSPTGARQHTIAAGEHIWWDYRAWGAVRDPWAVVGAWPAPFAGRRVAADAPFTAAAIGEGTTLTETSTWRILVGSQAEIARREAVWKRATDDPEGAGLTAVLVNGQVRALPRSGESYVTVEGGAALAAAVPTGPDQTAGVVMVVVGTTAANAQRAADRILREPDVLRSRYSVVFDAAGKPIFAGGQGPL